jgi:hypothetical protein
MSLPLPQDVNSIKHLAEIGVVFLLFNIGLELSLDRLASMAKQVFGMGSLQVIFTVVAIAGFGMCFAGLGVSSAIILGGALAMSTTAVGETVRGTDRQTDRQGEEAGERERRERQCVRAYVCALSPVCALLMSTAAVGACVCMCLEPSE